MRSSDPLTRLRRKSLILLGVAAGGYAVVALALVVGR